MIVVWGWQNCLGKIINGNKYINSLVEKNGFLIATLALLISTTTFTKSFTLWWLAPNCESMFVFDCAVSTNHLWDKKKSDTTILSSKIIPFSLTLGLKWLCGRLCTRKSTASLCLPCSSNYSQWIDLIGTMEVSYVTSLISSIRFLTSLSSTASKDFCSLCFPPLWLCLSWNQICHFTICFLMMNCGCCW